VQRYLTNKPKTEAGRELKFITGSMTEQDEETFTAILKAWRER
jgi:hypothetical protein